MRKLKQYLSTVVIIVLTLGGLLMSEKVKAQDGTTAAGEEEEETDPVVKELERRAKILELEQKIAEAEKAKLAAKLPVTEGSGVTGSTTFGEGSGYFAELLAYGSLRQAAAALAQQIGAPQDPNEKRVILTDQNLATLAHLREVAQSRIAAGNEHLKDLLNEYPADFNFGQSEAVAATLTALSAMLGAASDIASFFRTDLAVTNRDVEVTSAALLATAAEALRVQGWQPLLPAYRLQKTTLQAEVEALQATRGQLAERRRILGRSVQPTLQEAVRLEAELTDAKAELQRLLAVQPPMQQQIDAARAEVRRLRLELIPVATKKARWERVASDIDAALTATEALIKAMTEGADGKPSVLEAVAVADLVKAVPDAKVVYLETSSQGGEIHVAKGAFRTRLVYVGGVAISYLVLGRDGSVEKAGLIAMPLTRSTKAKDAASELTIP